MLQKRYLNFEGMLVAVRCNVILNEWGMLPDQPGQSGIDIDRSQGCDPFPFRIEGRTGADTVMVRPKDYDVLRDRNRPVNLTGYRSGVDIPCVGRDDPQRLLPATRRWDKGFQLSAQL